jgi:hypothetical protein
MSGEESRRIYRLLINKSYELSIVYFYLFLVMKLLSLLFVYLISCFLFKPWLPNHDKGDSSAI